MVEEINSETGTEYESIMVETEEEREIEVEETI